MWYGFSHRVMVIGYWSAMCNKFPSNAYMCDASILAFVIVVKCTTLEKNACNST